MTATVPEKLKPSGFWYVIGVLLLVASFVVPIVFIVLGVQAFQDELEKFDSVPIDGGGEVQLEADDYTVYVEGRGVDSFTPFSSSDVEILDPGGNPVSLSFTTSDNTYSVGGQDGVGVLTFTAPETGTYQVNPLESSTRSSNITEIAIGPGFGDVIGAGIVFWVLAGISGLVLFILGLVMLIVVAVKRGKQKRQRRLAVNANAFGGAGYGQPGYGAPAQPGYGGPAQPGYPPPPGAGDPPPGISGWSPPGQSPIS